MEKKKVNICENHLPEFFDAIKQGNLNLVEKLEHELTPSEECVACAYIFKTNGTVREALENYLSKEGFEVEMHAQESKRQELSFWIIRLLVFFAVFSLIFLVENAIRKFVVGGNFIVLNLNIAEYILIAVVSVIVFLAVDDRFLE